MTNILVLVDHARSRTHVSSALALVLDFALVVGHLEASHFRPPQLTDDPIRNPTDVGPLLVLLLLARCC